MNQKDRRRISKREADSCQKRVDSLPNRTRNPRQTEFSEIATESVGPEMKSRRTEPNRGEADQRFNENGGDWWKQNGIAEPRRKREAERNWVREGGGRKGEKF